MYSVFKKEIHAFLSSIVGYVAILVFLVACGFFLWVSTDTSILNYGYASLDMFFNIAPMLLMLLIPAVTMRTFADEYRSGTIEWLLTKPLTELQIILGKYFATLVLILLALIPTLIYVYTISQLSMIPGDIDRGSIIGSYVGLLFLAASFSAIGIFTSSLTNNQIVSFLGALVACYLMYTGFEALSNIPVFRGGADYYLNLIGMSLHYNAISKGFIDLKDIVYFLSIAVLFIAATKLSLNRRTWDNAIQD